MTEALIGAAVTLVAAFAGAWSAFMLEERRRVREQIRSRVAAVNRAQFVLIQQWNELTNIQSKMIEPKRTDPLRFISMRPSLPFGESTLRIDISELLFLLETDDREFLFLLVLENTRFETAIRAVNERSRMHIDELQPRLHAAGVQEGSSWALDDLVACLGEDLVKRVQRATDAAVEQVDLTVESCGTLTNRFRKAMKARFPAESIIYMAPNSPANICPEPARQEPVP